MDDGEGIEAAVKAEDPSQTISSPGGIGKDGKKGTESAGTTFGLDKNKREMDKVRLTSEAREIKEKLMDYVNEIIMRQNELDSVANFESFTNETAARRVLKDLINDFNKSVDTIGARCAGAEDKVGKLKSAIERHDTLMKKL